MEEETLVPLLERSVRRSFDQPAFSDFPGPAITYGEVAARVARLHAAFRELGVKPGAKIALLGRNSSGWATAFLGIVSFGAVAVPILWRAAIALRDGRPAEGDPCSVGTHGAVARRGDVVRA